MPSRIALSLLLALILGCPSQKAPSAADTGIAPAAPAKPVEQGPIVLGPPKAGTPYEYTRHDILLSAVSERPWRAHDIETSYTVRPMLGPDGEIRLTIEVQWVKGEAREDKYKIKVDSRDAALLKRVKNGADTTTAYDLVTSFAYIGHPLSVVLTPAGRIGRVEGGDAIRKAMLDMHPPAPKKSAHYQKRLELMLSDEALVTRLLPGLARMPEKPAAHGKRINEETKSDRIHYVGEMSRATLFERKGTGFLIRSKWALRPSEQASVVPSPKSGPKRVLLRGVGDLTVEHDELHPAFLMGGQQERQELTYVGIVDEEPGEYPMTYERTITWSRSDAPVPKIERPASRPSAPAHPASQPAHPAHPASQPAQPAHPASQPAPAGK